MRPIIITSSIIINSDAEKVWRALTNPSLTKKYMFGCEAISEWKPGTPLLWIGEYKGERMTFVKGEVVAYTPFKSLAYTTFDPNSTIPDIPDNYLTVTYSLTEENNKTKLTVTQGDYSKVADGERRYNESYNNGVGWNPILDLIKKLVESDQTG